MGKKDNVSRPVNHSATGATTPRQSLERQYDTSPPRTPPGQIGRPTKPKGGASAPRTRPALQDAFGDEMNEAQRQQNRDRSNSHGLSWSPKNARASVVDNMLLSLDNFGTGLGSSHGSTPPSAPDAQYASVQRLGSSSNGRPRGHTTSSSVSSNYSFHADSPASGYTRGHRSNSSSNFQSSLGRIDSVRRTDTEAGGNTGLGNFINGQERAITGHGISRKTGINGPAPESETSRVVGSMSRHQTSSGRRSSSLDNGYQQPHYSDNALPPSTTQDPYLHGDFEAAPTPTIPAGPRKEGSPSRSNGFRPGSSLSSAQTVPPKRRTSIRAPINIFNRNDRLEVPDSYGGRRGHQELAKTHSQSTSSSAYDPVTPVKRSNLPPSSGTLASTSKENTRPGFFKRVFGSSKSTPSSHNETTSSRKSAQSQNSGKATSRTGSFPMDSSANSASADPSPQQHKSAAKDKATKDTPTLNKKTSFFRRRRKSIHDDVPVVPIPPQSNQTHSNAEPDWHDFVPPDRRLYDEQPDSPSSLRKVMNPYLENHRRLESINSIDTHDSNRGNRVVPATTAYSTIRTVTTTNTVTAPNATTTSRTTFISQPGANASSSTARERPSISGRRYSSEDDRDLVGQNPANRVSNEGMRHSPSHTHARTQSDIDKDLPRLPVDYNAITYESSKAPNVPEPKQARKRTSSLEDNNHATIEPSVQKDFKPTRQPPERSSSRKQPDASARSEQLADQGSTNRVSDTTVEDYKSAHSNPASPVFDAPADTELAEETLEAISFPSVDPTEPLPEHRTFAEKLFAGNASVERTETAPWLGEAGPERAKVRRAYMELFDWKDLSILGALRGFCSSVQLKGETQQVDRVLDAISNRWCECNPDHGFKATDVVHTICYSVLLLNTDLHLADIESKMTRNQFIKNTMPTIRRVVADAAPDAFNNARSSVLPPPKRPTALADQGRSSSRFSTVSSEASEPLETISRPTYRLSTRPSDHSGSESFAPDDDCGPLVRTPFHGKMTTWELQVEVVLKNFYNSIRVHRLPLSGGEEQRPVPEHYPSSMSLSAVTGGMLRRSNSLLSKAGSETMPARGRMMESRAGSRWSSKARSRPRLYPASLAQSRTSIDEDQSAMSPSMSSMWSRYSLGRTQTSMSANSFGSEYPIGDYQRSIGFANALSQAIIREDPAADSTEELIRVGPLLEDESLGLEGAPWAKEGILKHKHHLEAVDKRAKDRSWSECFTVIEKGWIKLFQFNMNAKSLRQKARNKGNQGGVVGGGNWMENAQSLGQFLLRHTIASALPPPGYSKARPYVWALSLPTGAVHLFQAGTPEIVKEFVSTANYWSARLSKEPLVGGVSNVEYGWSERVINMSLVNDSNSISSNSRPPSTLPAPRPSFQASIRSSIDANSSRPKLPGDRIIISEWPPPTQSMMASQLLEVDQLRALTTYVKNIEEELKKHNQFRSPMLLAFTTRHPNHNKAMSNWERKSAYLLREIVKFSTYVESLQFANREKERVVEEREQRERAIDGEAGGEGHEEDGGLEMGSSQKPQRREVEV